jgi:hypothetical protein
MNVNLFAWIREGVKQAVLLGVSDAVETLGPHEQGDDLRERLLAVLKKETAKSGEPPSLDNPPRKRLGRTLKEIEATGGS